MTMTRRIVVALAAMLLLAACSGQATSQPTLTPTPTATQGVPHTLIANSPAPTPTPTATPSPSPTELPLAPGEVDVTFASFIADLQAGGSALDKYTPITDATLRADYQLFVNDPRVQATRIVRNTNLLEECLKAPGKMPDDVEIQQGNCGSELVGALRVVAKVSGDENVRLFASDMARFVTKSNLFTDSTAKANLLADLIAWAAA